MDGGAVGKIFISNGPTFEQIRETLETYDQTFPHTHIPQGLRENIEHFAIVENSCHFIFWKDYERTSFYRETSDALSYFRGCIHSNIKIIRDGTTNQNTYFFFIGKNEAKSLSFRLAQLLHIDLDQIDLRGRTILEIARADADRIIRGWWKDLGGRIDSIFLAGILMDESGDNELMQQIDSRADSISYIEYHSRTLDRTIGLSSRGVVLIRGGDATDENIVDYYNSHIKNRINSP